MVIKSVSAYFVAEGYTVSRGSIQMPGWYLHMEAAKLLADRLRNGDVPAGTTLTSTQATALGNTAHEWRNYLALGAIGPDLFFLLPDWKGLISNPMLHHIQWALDTYKNIDQTYLKPWEKWMGPVSENNTEILNNLTGGTLEEIGLGLQEMGKAIQDAILDLMTRMADVWGFLSSGVPQGVGETSFYWSDQLHYRKTYEFARQLFANAATPQQKAFAIGWMSHCAADVTGHGFVNEKCGGPWRLHWGRHHTLENFLDSDVYYKRHGTEPYGELRTAALHFRLAFRNRHDVPYNGQFEDAPAYDYFGSLPDYVNTDDPDFFREKLWDLESGDLPEDLCQLIIDTMKSVYGNDDGAHPSIAHVPRLLTTEASGLRDGTTGRPSVLAIQDTFTALYEFLRFSTTAGYSPRRPAPPEVFDMAIFDPPRFPGTDAGVSDDPGRGADPGHARHHSWELLLAIFAVAKWVIQMGEWLATLPLAIVNQILLLPAREVLYYFAVLPMWHLNMAFRLPLVLGGFLHAMPEELTPGLTELGKGNDELGLLLLLALQTPSGFPPHSFTVPEPSGHTAGAAHGDDPAYPRAMVTDTVQTMFLNLGFNSQPPPCDRADRPSEFLSPWRYPEENHASRANGWEPPLTFSGPFLTGADGTVLLNNSPGNSAARAAFEAATNEQATAAACAAHFPGGGHLGDPVDYGLYLVGKLTDPNSHVPDFNLDADRGYGYHCWDWTRKVGSSFERRHLPILVPTPFTFPEPCTVPELYCESAEPGTHAPATYDPTVHLSVYYLDQTAQSCDPTDPNYHPTPVTPAEIASAGGILPGGGRT